MSENKFSGFISKVLRSNLSQPPSRELKKEDFRVGNAYYYEKNIMKLASSNKDWRKKSKVLIDEEKVAQKIFRYTFVNKPVKLIPDPSNPHDKNAIMVFIAGEMVGHIKAEDNKHVNNILKSHEIKYITAYVSGGEYKVVSTNGDTVKADSPIGVNVRIAYV